MRELTRCIAWALGVGALALIAALLSDVGLAQADGALAWVLLIVYAPMYLLGHAMASGPMAEWVHDLRFAGIAAFAQFLYFLAIVAVVRHAYRSLVRPS